MYQIDFRKHNARIYFCGIGGSSMSGLAGMLKRLGFVVWGSDIAESAHTKQVETEGIRVLIPQKSENVTDDIDVAVFTAAISHDNPEYRAVEEKHIPHLTRAQLLGQMMAQYPMSIGIAGSHGKTTTTSFLSEILIRDHKDPTVQCGDILKSLGSSYHLGTSDLFIAEACEYTNSFLSLKPFIGIIMNIEADHLDFFKDIDDIRHSFRTYAESIPEAGYLIINTEIPHLEEIIRDLKCHIITFGMNRDIADYYPEDITFNEFAHPSFTAVRRNGASEKITLQVPGRQYILDALAAIAAADLCGASKDAIHDALYDYKGTARRFEYKGTKNGVRFVEDYAHHPTQVSLNIDAAMNIPHNRVIALFQPHTYSRTKAFLDEFAHALAKADIVLLTPIYAARETDNLGISSHDLETRIQALGTEVHCFDSFRAVEDWIRANGQKNDIVISMNAGSAVKIEEDILKD